MRSCPLARHLRRQLQTTNSSLYSTFEYSGCVVGLCRDGCQAQEAFPSWRWEVTAEEVSVLSSAFVRFPKSRLSQASKRTSWKYSCNPWGRHLLLPLTLPPLLSLGPAWAYEQASRASEG